MDSVVSSGAGPFLRPTGFVWKGVSYRVVRLWDFWSEAGSGWDPGKGEKTFLVETDPLDLLKLYRGTAGK